MKQHVMDHTGHTTHEIDKMKSAELAAAMQRFAELTGAGYIAAEKDSTTGDRKLVKSFNPEAEDVLFIPQLKGG